MAPPWGQKMWTVMSPLPVVDHAGVSAGWAQDRGVLRSNPDPSVVPVSRRVSMVVEGMIVIRGNRGMLPSSTSERFLFQPALPATRTRTREYETVVGVMGDGCGAPAVRGYRYLEAGREGLRTDPGPR
jgi:hypothetical protein